MLTRPAIQRLMKAGLIRVDPEPVKIGPNSIDLRLGSLQCYHPTTNRIRLVDPVLGEAYYALDPKNPPPLRPVPMTPSGQWLLVPGQFYLGSTLEETFCKGVIPHLDGRSTCGRLSIEVHKTAGVGDNGFQGRWTLEIEATEPVLITPGDRLFQVYFSPAWSTGLALILEALDQGGTVSLDHHGGIEKWDDVGMIAHGPLLEIEDLYGQEGDGSHYQGSRDVKGPAPLD